MDFVEDIYPRHTLYALAIRSPVACGRLKSIECPKLPSSYMLLTAADIPGENRLGDSQHPILADGNLSYIGEPVALLLGLDKNALEAYADQCKVVAEEGAPVFSTRSPPDSRVAARREIRVGEPEAAFARAASVVRGDYHTGIQEHWYAEPVGAVAWLEELESGAAASGRDELSGKGIAVRTATQWPFHAKRAVAQALSVSAAKVRVEPTHLGLHMDGKLWYPSLVSCHAALGAYIARKPVRLVLTRQEDFLFSPKRNEAEISIASAVDEAGEIIGTEISVAVNLGAYGVNAQEALDQACLGSMGAYKLGNLKLSGAAITTNTPPQGPFCGFGIAQGFFAMERHISHVADLRQMNPADWRKEKILKGGLLPLGAGAKGGLLGGQLIDTAAATSGYYRKWAAYELLRQSRRPRPAQAAAAEASRETWAQRGEPRRGVGIALGCQGSGLLYPGADKGNCSVELTLEKDGGLLVKTSAASSVGGCGGVWAEIAAGVLGVDPAAVRFAGSNSRDSGPATASRPITVLTRLVEQACAAIRKQRFRDPLPITVKKSAKAQKSPQWEELLPPPAGMACDAGSFSRPGWAAAVVEVEIDPIEHVPGIRGVWLCVDGGKILSPDRAHAALKTSAVLALGWASREYLGYADGSLPPQQFENYAICSPAEIPPVHIDFVPNNSEEPKGIGDLPFACIPAAFLQAVSQAMDCHFQSIPLNSPEIWEAAQTKKEGGAA